jgi:DNA-binding CsgD family transcriptional regulator
MARSIAGGAHSVLSVETGPNRRDDPGQNGLTVGIEGAARLLERERELAELDKVLSEVERGRGQVVVVEASSGLGKTSLLRAACATAEEAGFICLRARATELERDFAYGCVRQLLEPVVASSAGNDGLFEGAAALAKPLFTPAGMELPTLAADRSFSMLHGLYWLLNIVSDSNPVALVVDDVHWSDEESLRFLNYLTPRLDGLRVAVLASTRGAEKPTGLARLTASPETRVLRPAPLSREATLTLCEQRLGAMVASDFAAACWETTGGNPFFLESLLREIADKGLTTSLDEAARVPRLAPAAVTDAVLLRLTGAAPAASALVRAVAVLGDGASVPEAAAMTELAVGDVAGAADDLAALDILQPAERLEFCHPIVREAVRADIGRRELATAHARAITVLERCGAAPERIAAQIVEAEPTGDAGRVELLRQVAADALARGAPAAAVAWLSRALAEPPPSGSRVDVLLELGSAELRLGAPVAVSHLTEAVELSRDPEQLATAARRLAIALTLAGNPEHAVTALEAAIDVVGPGDSELVLLLEGEIWTHAVQAGLETRTRAARRLERCTEVLDGSTPGERLVLASLASTRARASETARDAAAHLESALADGRFVSDQQAGRVGLGLSFDLSLGLIAADALDVADAYLERMLTGAQAQAAILSVAYLTGRRGLLALQRGNVAAAEADGRTTLELLASHRISLGAPFALAVLVEALVEGGELDAAERELRERWSEQEIPPGPTSHLLLEARGLLRLAQGRPNDGLDDLVEFGRRDELWALINPLASRWRSHAALALAAGGDREGARRMALEDLDRARRWGAPSGVGVALRAVALTDDGADAVVGLREAVEALERSPARLEYARTLTDLGAALRRANRRTDARTALEEALDLAARCGARALADRARTELRVAGGRSRGPERIGLSALTASERRVAELAAEGHSNPEIAQTLYVTRKTVETHLGHVYRKLGVTGRGKLARAMAEMSTRS